MLGAFLQRDPWDREWRPACTSSFVSSWGSTHILGNDPLSHPEMEPGTCEPWDSSPVGSFRKSFPSWWKTELLLQGDLIIPFPSPGNWSRFPFNSAVGPSLCPSFLAHQLSHPGFSCVHVDNLNLVPEWVNLDFSETGSLRIFRKETYLIYICHYK